MPIRPSNGNVKQTGGSLGQGCKLKTKIRELSVHKKAFKERGVDEITNRLSTDKRTKKKNPNFEPQVNLIFGNVKEKQKIKEAD